MTRPPSPPRPSARTAVMAESLKLFASRGVEAVSVRDIAVASGFTNPALFRHFASKEALAESLFETCYRRLVEAMESAAASRDLRAWFVAVLGEIDASPESVLFVVDNLRRYWNSLPDDLKARNLPSLTIAMLDREAAAGRIARDADVQLAVTVILGALGQIARGAHFHERRVDPEPMAERLSDLLRLGLSAARPTPPEGSRA